MDPATIALASTILSYAVKYGIPAVRQIIEVIHKPNPTLEDWNKAFDTAEINAKIFLAETETLTKE